MKPDEHTDLSTAMGEAFFRQVLASSTDCIKVLSLDGELEFMSEGSLCIMEIDDFDRFCGAWWPDFWHGEGHSLDTQNPVES